MAQQRIAVWHGTAKEMTKLRLAVDRDCTCKDDPPSCGAPHKLLVDQASLDRLLFMHRIADQLMVEEWR